MSSIIVDFDGTIADSLPVVINMYYDWAKVEPFSKDTIERFRNSSIKAVLREVGIPLWRLPRLVVLARRQFADHVQDVPVFTGIPEVLKHLHNDGHAMYLISSNGAQNIRKFLKKNNIDSYFSAVQGNIGVFGKANAIRSIIVRYKIDRNDCISVGDETRDVDAAKKARIKCVAVTWGYNGQKILKAHKPDYMVHTRPELLNILT